MIYCTNEIRAKVWHVGIYNGFKMISFTTSEKTRNGNYQSSSWFARLMSDSKDKLQNVQKGDSILIKRCAIRNTYNKEKDREYLGVDIYDAEVVTASLGAEPDDDYN